MPALSISNRFLPRERREARKVADRMLGTTPPAETFIGWNASLFGKVAMVVCWRYDGRIEGHQDFEFAAKLVTLVPALMAGGFDRIDSDELFGFYDSLAYFPARDSDLDRVFAVVSDLWNQLRPSAQGEVSTVERESSASPLGRLIRRLREERHLSQNRLAVLAGCDGQTISNLETGRTQSLRDSLIDRIANVFGLTGEELRRAAGE